MRGSRDPSGAEPATGEGESDGEMDGKDVGQSTRRGKARYLCC